MEKYALKHEDTSYSENLKSSVKMAAISAIQCSGESSLKNFWEKTGKEWLKKGGERSL